MSEQDYDWDFEGMTDEELDYYLDQLKGTNLEEFAPRLKALYKRLRAEAAAEQVPDAFKDVIQDLDLDSDESENAG